MTNDEIEALYEGYPFTPLTADSNYSPKKPSGGARVSGIIGDILESRGLMGEHLDHVTYLGPEGPFVARGVLGTYEPDGRRNIKVSELNATDETFRNYGFDR